MALDGDRYKKGSFPPFVTFGDANTFAEKIYENGGGRASYDLLSQIFDNSIKSSSFTKKLAAIKWFGLVAEPTKGEVVLSDIGLAIAAPQSTNAASSAKKEAFLKIEPFAKIYERHKGKLLPADEFLKNIFEQDSGIPKDLSASWVSAFKEAIRTTGLLYDRGDQKTQIMESPTIALGRTSNVSLAQLDTAAESKENTPVESQPAPGPSSVPTGHSTTIALSGQRFAVFSIPDSLTTRDAQKLKSAISGLTAIIDSMVDEQK